MFLLEYHYVSSFDFAPEMNGMFELYVLCLIPQRVNQIIDVELPDCFLWSEANILVADQALDVRALTLHEDCGFYCVVGFGAEHGAFVR